MSPDSSLPPWLKAAMYLGVPSVIALFLVYALTTQMAARMERIERQQAVNTASFEEVKALVHEQSEALAEIADLVRRNCFIAARTEDERTACLHDQHQPRK